MCVCPALFVSNIDSWLIHCEVLHYFLDAMRHVDIFICNKVHGQLILTLQPNRRVVVTVTVV